jgi:hypothetical protein
MKYFLALLFSISCTYTNAQKTLQLIDISKPQISVLKMLENYPKLDSSSRSKVLIDSIYIPYKTFWNGYLGNENDVAEFMDGQRKHIPQIKRQNKLVDLKELEQQFKQIRKKMSRMTRVPSQRDLVYCLWACLDRFGWIG